MLDVGSLAPDLETTTVDGTPFRLSEASALCTLVYFFQGASGPLCRRQAECFRDDHAELLFAGARIAGAGTDDPAALRRFVEERAP